jgi:hypothetical protein
MYLRDTLLRTAEAGLYQLHWSQEILDGVFHNLIAKQQITDSQVIRSEQAIKSAFPDAMVEVPQRLLPCMDNHPGDHHVLSAALIAKTQVIVTNNLKHFPPSSLEQFRVEAQSADQLLTALYDLFPESLHSMLQTQVSGLRNPSMSVPELLTLLERSVPIFVSRCR